MLFAKISFGLSNPRAAVRLMTVKRRSAAPKAEGKIAMKYMLLIYDDPAWREGEQGRKLLSDIVAQHMRLGEDLRAAGVAFSGHQLQPAAMTTTVRTAGGAQTLHDGPFAETHEQLGGYYLIDVPDLDAAIGWARRIPAPGKGSVEVRPIVER